MAECQNIAERRDPISMVATHNSKCLDRCGLTIHAGHDEIEPGHHGWRHEDCERARIEAWVRERFAAGDDCLTVQFKIAKDSRLDADVKMMASCYCLVWADRIAASAVGPNPGPE